METLVHKGQHKTAGFEKLYPLGKVPVLQKGEFILSEAAAILSFLANTQPVPDHWYPGK